MRRTLPLIVVTATLLFTACGSDDATTTDNSVDAAVTTPDGTTDPLATTPADGSSDVSTPGDGSAPTPVTNPDKPEVQIPDEIPTELKVTTITEGSGTEAVEGDTVIVDYVGVRSKDGVEFDNSYDRFEPFPVVLGGGSVIAGWDQGLVGTQAGDRVQIDIPAELAYGDQPRGDIIGANEALTFLIDVRAIIQPPDPADAPTEAGVPASEGATETTFADLRDGDGDELQPGQTGVVNYVLYRGDDLTSLESSWTAQPVQVSTATGGFPGFVNGLPGMKVGGRRAIIVPPADAFGPDGNPDLGLPAGTDMILVVDLLGVYGTPE